MPDLRCPCCDAPLGVPALLPGAAWSAEQDALLLALRRRSVSWKVISRVFGIAPDTARRRGYALRLPPEPKPVRARTTAQRAALEAARTRRRMVRARALGLSPSPPVPPPG